MTALQKADGVRGTAAGSADFQETGCQNAGSPIQHRIASDKPSGHRRTDADPTAAVLSIVTVLGCAERRDVEGVHRARLQSVVAVRAGNARSAN